MSTQVYFGTPGNDFFTVTAPFLLDSWIIQGQAGNDALFGGNVNDYVYGGDGNDSLSGLAGDDFLDGGTGDDTLSGGTGNDTSRGDIGNDTVIGNLGNDYFDGGAGIDVADYSSLVNSSFVPQGITLLPTGTVLKGSSGTDQLFQVETIIANAAASNNTIDVSSSASPAFIVVNLAALSSNLQVFNVGGSPTPLTFTVRNFDNVIGTNQNDTITGDSQNNQLSGNGGNDTIFGSAGNDTINGGAGNDTANYSALGGAVTLGAFGVLNKGVLGTDSLVSIETIIGSAGGGDTVDHSGAVSGGGITVTGTTTNLTTGLVTVNGSPAPLPLSFTVQGFENVIGSNFADSITGNAANNALSGGTGNDTIFGSAGNDTIDGGVGTDTVDYSTLGQVVTLKPTGVVTKGALGTDNLTKIEKIVGSSLIGDTIDASTAFAPATGIIANLTTGNVTVTGTAPLPLSFTVSNFENVTGTNFADTITGDGQNNVLIGNAGNDTLDGGVGNDTLDGGIGNDSLLGGLGNDSLVGGNGNDSLVGGSGLDTLIGVNALNANAGTNEIDILTGGTIDSDRFVLADAAQLYYQNTSAAAFGVNDYASITDFQSGVDKLVLKSGINYLTTTTSPVAGITGNFFVFRDNAGIGTLSAADDLVVAIAGTFSGTDVILV